MGRLISSWARPCVERDIQGGVRLYPWPRSYGHVELRSKQVFQSCPPLSKMLRKIDGTLCLAFLTCGGALRILRRYQPRLENGLHNLGIRKLRAQSNTEEAK